MICGLGLREFWLLIVSLSGLVACGLIAYGVLVVVCELGLRVG